MSKLPKLIFQKSSLYLGTRNDKGLLCNIYTPLQNLADEKTKKLGDFTTLQLNFDLEHPVDIILLDSYDGAVNMIINDGKNTPKLINSRFSVLDENTFKIPDHSGFKDTNIYDEATFAADTNLKAIPIKIPKVEYLGLLNNAGKMSCGEYTFYFKLSDVDGNETEVIAESGIVTCHIGDINTPSTIRMGLENENSNKAIKFELSNIDSGFDFIHVLFSRVTSGADLAGITLFYKVLYDYPINKDGVCIITITGAEAIIKTSLEECYLDYADINSVKTLVINNNTLFFGNVDTPEHDWDAIKRFTWKIIPRWYQSASGNIGSLNSSYEETSISETDIEDHGYCYYNTKNIYYRVGYWPDEIYRFGIVYIFNDNSLSPVINLLGIDFSKVSNQLDSKHTTTQFLEADNYEQIFFTEDTNNLNRGAEYLYESDTLYFNEKYRTNSRGVIKFPIADRSNRLLDILHVKNGVMAPLPLYINFDLSLIGYKYAKKPIGLGSWNEGDVTDWKDVLKKHNIKGYFFVRQKRIPTILGLGLIIGHTDKDRGCLPVLKNNSNKFIIQPFLNKDRLLQEESEDYEISNNTTFPLFDYLAMLCPDAELEEATFNQLFVSNKYSLNKTTKYSFLYDSSTFTSNIDNTNIASYSDLTTSYLTKLTNIPEDTKLLTNGSDYFSTLAGNPSEAYKTADVENIWKKTLPLYLTVSTSLVRGLWGSYVGLSNPNENNPITLECPFLYGDLYNIKLAEYNDPEKATELDFIRIMNSNNTFYSISHRMLFLETPNIYTTIYNKSVDCFRGDCFPSMFTHRMFRNFIDPELPTNTKIVDPACWYKNYGVRCTAEIKTSAYSNLTDDTQGWYVDPNGEDKTNGIVQALVYLLTGNIFGFIAALIGMGDAFSLELRKLAKQTYEEYGYANEIVTAFEVYVGGLAFNPLFPLHSLVDIIVNAVHHIKNWDEPTKKKVNPKEQEVSGSINLKAIFKSDDDWVLRGLSSINRADVNAVALGLWITFPILSNKNLAMRDVDFSNATEEASFNRKRSFYPLYPKDRHNPLRDSNVCTYTIKTSLPSKEYLQLPKVPYIKLEFFTRVNYSNPNSSNSITNSFKVMPLNNYEDFTKLYGSITKLISRGNIIYVIFKHGIGAFLLQSLELKTPLLIVSNKFGSIWKDSIIQTPSGIYGVDSVAKNIWKLSEAGFEIISDMKIEKFLIDNLDFSEFNFRPYIGHINVKTHYNAFKHDLIFTYYNDLLYELPDGYSTYNGYSVDLDGFVIDSNNEKVLIQTSSEEDPKYIQATKLLPKYKIDYKLPSNYSEDTYSVDEDGYIIYKQTKERVKPLIKAIVYNSSWQSFSDLILDGKTCWVKGTNWSVCWNEDLKHFLTFYDWFPLESENINNIYFSFDKDSIDSLYLNSKNLLLNLSCFETNGSNTKAKNWNLYIPTKKNLIDNAFTNSTNYFYVKDIYLKGNFVSSGYTLYCKGELDLLKAKTTSLLPGEIGVLSFYVKNPNYVSGSNNSLDYEILFTTGTTFKSKITFVDNEWRFITVFIKVNKSAITNTFKLIIFNGNTTPNKVSYLICEPKFLLYNGDDLTFNDSLDIDYIEYITRKDNGYFKKYYNIRSIDNSLKLWKHGLAGVYDNLGEIKPTNWYGKLHEFNFEFVVNLNANYLKIFNNLKIISNKTAPYKFEYEVVGESYEWFEYKPVILWINTKVKSGVFDTLADAYKEVLSKNYLTLKQTYSDFPSLFGKDATYVIPKLPYLEIKLTDKKGLPDKDKSYTDTDAWSDLDPTKDAYKYNTVETILVEDKLLSEYRIHTEQLGNDMKKYGRVRGNMLYLEDLWDIEIRPVGFKYCYLNALQLLEFTTLEETRLRDKYIKIKIRYTGEDLAVIQQISTMFDYSFA